MAPNKNIQTYLGKLVHCPNHPDLKDPVRCPAGCPQPVSILRPSSTGNRNPQVRHVTVIRSWKMTCSRGKYSSRKGWESSNQLVNVLDTFSWCQAFCSVYINVLIHSTSAFTKCILYVCMYVCIHDHACMYIHNWCIYTILCYKHNTYSISLHVRVSLQPKKKNKASLHRAKCEDPSKYRSMLRAWNLIPAIFTPFPGASAAGDRVKLESSWLPEIPASRNLPRSKLPAACGPTQVTRCRRSIGHCCHPILYQFPFNKCSNVSHCFWLIRICPHHPDYHPSGYLPANYQHTETLRKWSANIIYSYSIVYPCIVQYMSGQ